MRRKEQNDENLGEDEAAFIAMHIVSAELGSGSNVDVNKITKLINAVLQIVRIHFKIEFNEENEYAYSGVRKIVEYIEKQYSYKLTIDERLYLLIHIKRILDEQSE